MASVGPDSLNAIKSLTSSDRPRVTAVLTGTAEFDEIKRQLGGDHSIVKCAVSPPPGRPFGCLVAKVRDPELYVGLLNGMGIDASVVDIKTMPKLRIKWGATSGAFVMTHAQARDLLGEDYTLSEVYAKDGVIR